MSRETNEPGNALILAAHAKQWDVCRTLMQQGAAINWFISSGDNQNYCPIHFFAENGQSDLVTLAIQRGAVLTEQTSKNKTPFQLAMNNSHWETVAAIATLHAATTSDEQSHYGHALILAAHAKQWDVCRTLMQQGAAINWFISSGDNQNYCPIHFFAENGQSDLVTLAIQRGAVLTEQTSKNKTPIQLASDNGHWETILVANRIFPATTDDSEGYGGALIRAANTGEISFCEGFSNQNRNRQFIVVDTHPISALIVAISTQQYDVAHRIISSLISFKDYFSDKHFQSNRVTDFFTRHCDFRGHDLNTELAVELLSCGVPISRLSVNTQSSLHEQNISLFTLRAYYAVLISKVPAALLEGKHLPTHEGNVGASRFTAIGMFTNIEFLEFTRWLSMLRSYSAGNNLSGILQQLNDPVTKCNTIIFNYIDCEYMNSLYRQLREEKSPFSLSSLFSSPTDQKKRKRDLMQFFQDSLQALNSSTLDRMAILVKKHKTAVFSLPVDNIHFQIIFYFACFLARANYPRQLFLPEASESIGALMLKCEDIDADNLVFVGDSFENATIYIADEVILEFSQSHVFKDPVTRAELNEQTIKQLLRHPKIRDAVVMAHEKELKDRRESNLQERLQIVNEVVVQLRVLGEALWNASTDSGRSVFDEASANTAVENFQRYSQNIPSSVTNALNNSQLCFYLSSRNARTSYSELFSQLTYNGCSGQLGVAVRQWIAEFEKVKVKAALIDSISPVTTMSPHLKFMSENSVASIYLHRSTPDHRMNGRFLSSNFKTLLDRSLQSDRVAYASPCLRKK